jgi:hypothetical protein
MERAEWGKEMRPPTETAYFSAVETDPNVVFKLDPRPFTTMIIATEMPAAISPYSITEAASPDTVPVAYPDVTSVRNFDGAITSIYGGVAG